MTKKEFTYLKEVLKERSSLNMQEVLEILVDMAEKFGVTDDSSLTSSISSSPIYRYTIPVSNMSSTIGQKS